MCRPPIWAPFAVRAAVERAGVDGALIDECIMGNVIGAGLGQAPARQAALRGGLPDSVGALTINKVCGSGLKAVMLAGALIRPARRGDRGRRDGEYDARAAPAAAGARRLPARQWRIGRRDRSRWAMVRVREITIWAIRPNGSRATSMSAARRKMPLRSNRTRARSPRRMPACFAEELVPVTVSAGHGKAITISADEPPRRDSDAKALAGLRPAFASDGTVTAGNAPGITDGAAALVVTSAQAARELGLRPLARIIGAAQAAVKPLELFTAPVFAMRRLMERTNTSLDSYDLFEINEAFAAQVVANGRELGIDWDRLNVNGGAIALGHPIGASGARVLVTLIHALVRRGGGRGIASLCLGGGEAVALAIEVF